jgi:methionyl-tRNA synthetase
MAQLQPSKALESLFALVREGNTYLEREAPFTRIKTDPRGADTILYNVLELLRWLGLMLEPFIPERARELRRQLGLPIGTDAAPESAEWPTVWGALPDGTVIQKGATLFPRLDPDRSKELLDKWRAARRAAAEKQSQQSAATTAAVPATPAPAPATAPAEAAPLPEITIDEFKRLDLRIAKVLAAQKVPKKDRLLQVELDLGPLGKRQVVAGLAQLCPPEQLVGRTVVFLSNLKPAKIGGIVSAGMILAIGDAEILGLLTADRDIAPGAAIR